MNRGLPPRRESARDCVALLRTAAGRNPFDRQLSDLVGELSTRSEEFRDYWATHDVVPHNKGEKTFNHPTVGELELSYNRIELSADPGLTVVVYTAEPGSRSEEAFRLLASWAATEAGKAEPSSSTRETAAPASALTSRERSGQVRRSCSSVPSLGAGGGTRRASLSTQAGSLFPRRAGVALPCCRPLQWNVIEGGPPPRRCGRRKEVGPPYRTAYVRRARLRPARPAIRNREPTRHHGTRRAGLILPARAGRGGELLLHAGLDLSRKRVDVCLVSDRGELIGHLRARDDRDGLHGLARRVAVHGGPVRGVGSR
jgi:MmyB-like transcription regulator ligand binding domain